MVPRVGHKKAGSGPFKIGVANNVKKRLDILQTGNPRRLKLITKIGPMGREQAFTMEKWFHTRLSSAAMTGEWFSPKCRGYLRKLLKEESSRQEISIRSQKAETRFCPRN